MQSDNDMNAEPSRLTADSLPEVWPERETPSEPTPVEEPSAALARRERELGERELAAETLNAELMARKAKIEQAERALAADISARRLALRESLETERANALKGAQEIAGRILAEAKEGAESLRRAHEERMSAEKADAANEKEAFTRKRTEFIGLTRRYGAHLAEREKAVEEAEMNRDLGFREQREALDRALSEQKAQAVARMEEGLAQEAGIRRNAALAEAETRRLGLDAELAAMRSAAERERDESAARSRAEREAFQERSRELDERDAGLADDEADLERREKEAELRELRMDAERDRLEETLKELVAARGRSYDEKERLVEEECARLRGETAQLQRRCDGFATLSLRFPDDPLMLLKKLEEAENQLEHLRNEIGRRPSTDLQALHDTLESELSATRARFQEREAEIQTLRRQAAAQDELEGRITQLDSSLQRAQSRNAILEGVCARLESDLERLSAGFAKSADREIRISEIEAPYFDAPHERKSEQPDELAWLKNIEDSCRDHGLRFPPRILHAFHTSLKTAEWSPLTVLAGVSGTGKSELPRLYALFGGLKFMNTPVQPNWDSQEAMLGFFNSMDNKFDAQPLLRLLAQTQKPPGEPNGPGLQDAMTLILLDEMNLAHVELYFAEFLSKLEQRRGLTADHLPKLEVKLGAGVAPYAIPLGRNLLWTGTMNQDETTKSLSDKVLDRGFQIHFPSPEEFVRRTELKPLPAPEDIPLLAYAHWSEWRQFESHFDDRQISPYTTMVKEINKAMNTVGRALGHRVWQSQEYYMANYPEVIAAQNAGDELRLEQAMRTAFEDQLVLKIMPKLRGVDTRGASKTGCLDRIRELLVENGYDALLGDFNRACEVGYGQFIWSSADYLRQPAAEEQAP